MPITSYQAASTVVGEFFELCTAKMFRGYRRAVFGRAGDNPDVVTSSGRIIESKAAGHGRWLLEAKQLQQLEQTPHALYALWEYDAPAAGGLTQHGTAAALRAWLAEHIIGCTLLPATLPRVILAGTLHAEPRQATGAGRIWGSNYWFKRHYLEDVVERRRRLSARVLRRRWPCTLGSIAGVELPSVTVTRLFAVRQPIQQVRACPHCGARRQPPHDTPTPEEQMLARIGLQQLEAQQRRIAIVPLDDGRKIRVVESRTPAWYRVLWERRNSNVPKHWGNKRRKGQRAYQSIRGYVRNALTAIVNGCIRTHHRAMDREILEVLEEALGAER